MLQGATARKSGLSLIDQGVVSGTNFLTTVLIGRVCGVDELGIYSLGFSLLVFTTNIHESLILAPYTVYVNRLEPQKRAEYAGSILIHHILLSAVAMLCLSAFAFALMLEFGPQRLILLIWLLVGVIPFTLLKEFGRRFTLAHLHLVTTLILDIAVAILQIGGLLWLAYTDNLSGIIAFYAVGVASGVAGVIWLVLTGSKMRVRWALIRSEWFRSFRFGKWVFASNVTGTMHAYSMYWLLALVHDTTATGAFAACWSIVLIANPLLLGIGNVLSPRAARGFVDGGKSEVRRVVYKTSLLLGIVMTAFCGLVFIFGDGLIQLLYGSEFGGHEHTINILAITMLASALLITSDQGLKVLEKPNINFKASMLGIFATLAVAPFLVFNWSLLGASYSFLIGCIIALVVRWLAFSSAVSGLGAAEPIVCD